MTEMMAAEPALAERLLTRLADADRRRPPSWPNVFVACSRRWSADPRRRLWHERARRDGRRSHPRGRAPADRLADACRGRPGVRGGPGAAGPAGSSSGCRTREVRGPRSRPSRRPARAGATTATGDRQRPLSGRRSSRTSWCATEEADQSWCHTVGYLSPILAALAVAGHLTGEHPDPADMRTALTLASTRPVPPKTIAADWRTRRRS